MGANGCKHGNNDRRKITQQAEAENSVRHINSVTADSKMESFSGGCNLSPECNNILLCLLF
jgi:hypothetical protein